MESAYCLFAVSSLKVTPNSSSNSGSAFDTPRTNLSKASSKPTPIAVETFLAAIAMSSICLGENPFAMPIAAAAPASRNPNMAPLASCILLVTRESAVPVAFENCTCPR